MFSTLLSVSRLIKSVFQVPKVKFKQKQNNKIKPNKLYTTVYMQDKFEIFCWLVTAVKHKIQNHRILKDMNYIHL